MGNQGSTSHACSTDRIRELNDILRKRNEGGRVHFTPGIADLPMLTIGRIWMAVREFDDFTSGNDSHGEHDFGCVVVDDHEVFWKIDYYGVDLDSASPDPSDWTVTCRVMTVMLASEY